MDMRCVSHRARRIGEWRLRFVLPNRRLVPEQADARFRAEKSCLIHYMTTRWRVSEVYVLEDYAILAQIDFHNLEQHPMQLNFNLFTKGQGCK